MNSLIGINKFISISALIIIYEFVILSLFYARVINKTIASNFVSFLILLNFFIIFVMFLTDCEIDSNIKLFIVFIKTLLLIAVLFIARFSLKNYFISLLILAIYYLVSNINEVYSCNVKLEQLGLSLLLSSLIYFGLIFSNKKCNLK